jgi:hypothetical protein
VISILLGKESLKVGQVVLYPCCLKKELLAMARKTLSFKEWKDLLNGHSQYPTENTYGMENNFKF